MKIYNKNEVIELGKKYSFKLRISFSLVLFIAFIIYGARLLVYISEVGIEDTGSIVVTVFVFILLLAAIIVAVRKYNHLKYGTKYIGYRIRKSVRFANYSRNENNVAKYKEADLFRLLSEDDSVLYFDETDVEASPKIKKRKGTNAYHYRGPSNDNDDPYKEALSSLDGEKDFDELSDDGKIAYYDILDDD